VAVLYARDRKIRVHKTQGTWVVWGGLEPYFLRSWEQVLHFVRSGEYWRSEMPSALNEAYWEAQWRG
jgi:hypothetical protein